MGMWQKEATPSSWQEEQEEEDLLLDADFCTVLNACLDKLPAQYQHVVRLKIMFDEDTDEVCDNLGISQTNLWQIVHRTKLRLRKCINQYWFQR